jgi:hypothetical protein
LKTTALIQQLTANPRRIFLIDGLGALLTAFLLCVVLPSFQKFFGMPVRVLYVLGAVAVVFAVYSFSCYRWVTASHRIFLAAIIIANLLYCVASLGLVIYYFQLLTIWGLLYFAGEIIVILALAALEISCLKRFAKETE